MMALRRARKLMVGLVLMAAPVALGQGGPPWGNGEPPWETRKREAQDRLGGLAPEILAKQSLEPVVVPAMEEMLEAAAKAARETATPLLELEPHAGAVRRVPAEYPTIQAALDAARAGDTVLVAPGTYSELLVMKDGVRLTSDPAGGGEELVVVEGARMRLPRRTLRTILDGTGSEPSSHGMIDFDPGVGRQTVVDGFTIQNLPEQNHHVPGHAHALNVRGASPVIMNCLVRSNGSTGIGNHVVYKDQAQPMPQRDLRFANIQHQASAVVYHNIIHGNLGLGVGCNHFSSPFVLGNEIFGNDDSKLGEDPTPGIGCKHGASPTIVGNLVHDNPGGGILAREGERQGAHFIDRPTHPVITHNVVMGNGKVRPGISAGSAGDEERPVWIAGNFVLGTGAVGIGLKDGSVGIVEDNLVADTPLPGIALQGAVVLKLDRNRVTRSGAPGFTFTAGSVVRRMEGNAAQEVKGPRFMVEGASFGADAPVPTDD